MINARHILCLVVIFLITTTIYAQKRVLEINDYFSLKDVRDPQVSPDGKWVAYTVREQMLEKEKSETRIWMVPIDGGTPMPMTAKGSSASRPRWSPDGKYLSFLANRDKSKNQVWTLNRQGGEAEQMTFVKQGVNGFWWSPDGKKILLRIKDQKELKEKDDEKKKPKPHVITRLQFKRDYIGYLDTLYHHLHVQAPGDTVTKQLTFGPYEDQNPAWSPDGQHIAFVSNRTPNPDGNNNTDIWSFSLDDPQNLKQLTTNPGSDNEPSWSPDGAKLVYETVTQPELFWYATQHMAIIPAGGGTPQLIANSTDRNMNNPYFSKDGRSIYCEIENSGERHLVQWDLKKGKLNYLSIGGLSLRNPHMGASGQIAAIISKPELPAEVFTLDKEAWKQLTHTNKTLLDSIHMARVENVTFPSKDGTEIEGFIFFPPNFENGKKYPTLLRIHGGPVSQYDFSYRFDAQLLASQGYLVVLTNPRGSSGYGQEFSMGIYQDWGNKDFDDVNAGIDYAIKQGYADPDRLGVGGWSYGGILTNYVITKTDRFKAAVSGASEALYVANYGHDHYQYAWEIEFGLPWENRELWEKLSPFNSVQNIVTPTLFMGGEKDWNVPILNSEQMYQSMKRLGRTTQLVVYPGEHHGIRRPSFIKDRFQRYIDWYGQFLKPN